MWDGGLQGEEATVLSASLTDFLAYGPGKSVFPKLLEGFRPNESGAPKSFGEALLAAELQPMTVNDSWRRWVPSPR